MVALKTFNNLEIDRQQEIIDVSLEEFALNNYESASLTPILEELGIAKGSFYRYFESKKNLYYFLLDYCVEKRKKNDQSLIQNPPEDFFKLILEHLKAKVHFDKEYPLASAFLYNVLHERNSTELGNIKFIRNEKMLSLTTEVVKNYMAINQIRADIEPEIIAWKVMQNQVMMFDFLEHRFNQDYRHNIKTHKKLYDVPFDEVVAVAEKFIEILKRGLKPYENN